MNNRILPLLLMLISSYANAQLLNWSPSFIKETDNIIELTVDGSKGNADLNNYTPSNDVFVHIGAITNLSTGPADWKYVKFTWATTPPLANCTFLGNNKWKYTITGGLRNFFGITNANERVIRISILFRNGAGTKVQRNTDGSDMYVPVYDNAAYIRIDNPLRQPLYNTAPEPINKNIGDAIAITANASVAGNIALFFNGNNIGNASNSITASANSTITTSGEQVLVARTTVGATVVADTVKFLVVPPINQLPLPVGVRDGINYEPGDTSVTLVLFAPNKTRVSLLGDFNNWTETVQQQMNRTPDGNRYWIRLTGLIPGTEYGYQYLIDGALKVADYYTEKVLDPNNDGFIPATTYPNLKPYPVGRTSGNVSIIQTAKPNYTWQVNNFAKPDKKNLIIYELLVRDFVAAKNWQTLKDTIGYFKKLGINAIELMPINEFEGNESWGYNPSFYFAPDKYYGTENAFKAFVDECHRNGIAVILDIALNHSFGQSPMVQMYWDAANNRPAANNPWFNQAAKHAFNVGYDMNHEAQATKDFVDRVLEHWLVKYKVDGFRFDLSKGFTQTQTCDNNGANCNVGAWSNYDASRIALLSRINTKMQQYQAGSYCILEHFADNTEEKELSNAGMLLWGNLNYNFNEGTMGFIPNSNFSGAIAATRTWTNNHLIAYQESHDEERLMYKNLQFGNNTNAAHNVRTLPIALKRNGMATAFWAMIPGPKMLWQFGELGYDFSINTCADGVTVDNNCRLANKPIKWDYLTNTDRKRLLNVYTKLFALRNKPNYQNTFTIGTTTQTLSGAVKTLTVNSDSLKIVVIGNFDVNAQTASINFPNTGNWFSVLDTTYRAVANISETITLQPSEYYVYVSKNVNNVTVAPPVVVPPVIPPVVPPVVPPPTPAPVITQAAINIYPNPSVGTNAVVNIAIPQGGGKVIVDILDASGKLCATLYNNRIATTGNVSIPLNSAGFNARRLQGGVYFVRMQHNGNTITKRFIITY